MKNLQILTFLFGAILLLGCSEDSDQILTTEVTQDVNIEEQPDAPKSKMPDFIPELPSTNERISLKFNSEGVFATIDDVWIYGEDFADISGWQILEIREEYWQQGSEHWFYRFENKDWVWFENLVLTEGSYIYVKYGVSTAYFPTESNWMKIPLYQI